MIKCPEPSYGQTQESAFLNTQAKVSFQHFEKNKQKMSPAQTLNLVTFYISAH